MGAHCLNILKNPFSCQLAQKDIAGISRPSAHWLFDLLRMKHSLLQNSAAISKVGHKGLLTYKGKDGSPVLRRPNAIEWLDPAAGHSEAAARNITTDLSYPHDRQSYDDRCSGQDRSERRRNPASGAIFDAERRSLDEEVKRRCNADGHSGHPQIVDQPAV
jgi:hypothetical protein